MIYFFLNNIESSHHKWWNWNQATERKITFDKIRAILQKHWHFCTIAQTLKTCGVFFPQPSNFCNFKFRIWNYLGHFQYRVCHSQGVLWIDDVGCWSNDYSNLRKERWKLVEGGQKGPTTGCRSRGRRVAKKLNGCFLSCWSSYSAQSQDPWSFALP